MTRQERIDRYLATVASLPAEEQKKHDDVILRWIIEALTKRADEAARRA